MVSIGARIGDMTNEDASNGLIKIIPAEDARFLFTTSGSGYRSPPPVLNREQEAVALLREIVGCNPYYTDDYGRTLCVFCYCEHEAGHEANCEWARAKAFVDAS